MVHIFILFLLRNFPIAVKRKEEKSVLNFCVSMGKGSRIQKEKTNDLEEELMKVKIMKEIWTLCLRQTAFLWLFY